MSLYVIQTLQSRQDFMTITSITRICLINTRRSIIWLVLMRQLKYHLPQEVSMHLLVWISVLIGWKVIECTDVCIKDEEHIILWKIAELIWVINITQEYALGIRRTYHPLEDCSTNLNDRVKYALKYAPKNDAQKRTRISWLIVERINSWINPWLILPINLPRK